MFSSFPANLLLYKKHLVDYIFVYILASGVYRNGFEVVYLISFVQQVLLLACMCIENIIIVRI